MFIYTLVLTLLCYLFLENAVLYSISMSHNVFCFYIMTLFYVFCNVQLLSGIKKFFSSSFDYQND